MHATSLSGKPWQITYRARKLKPRAKEFINRFNLYKQSEAVTLWTDLWKTFLFLKGYNFILWSSAPCFRNHWTSYFPTTKGVISFWPKLESCLAWSKGRLLWININSSILTLAIIKYFTACFLKKMQRDLFLYLHEGFKNNLRIKEKQNCVWSTR